MQDKRWNTFKNHPNICVFSCSFLAGFYCSFLMFLASSSDAEGMSGLMYLVMGAAFGIFLIYPTALTLQNAWQLCCRRYLDERLNTAKITDMITVLWGAVCIRCYLMILNIPMADWVTALPFCGTHGFAAGFFPIIAAVNLAAFPGWVSLRYVPKEKLPPFFRVPAAAALFLNSGFCILFSILFVKKSVLMALYPFNLFLLSAKTIRQLHRPQG